MPVARKTKEEAEATRERLLDAAEEVFLEKGVSCTSLEAIARGAGATRGALYWHFRDKADLFEAMVARVRPPLGDVADELAGASDADPLDIVRTRCRSCLEQLAADPRHRRIYTILFHRCEHGGQQDAVATKQDESSREFLQLLERHFARAAELNMLNPAVSPHAAAWALHAYMGGVISQYLRDPDQLDIARYADELINSFFDGIQA